jgi:hypothetical protein
MRKSKNFPWGKALHLIGKSKRGHRTMCIYDTVDNTGHWHVLAMVKDCLPGFDAPLHLLIDKPLPKQLKAALLNSGVPASVVQPHTTKEKR